MSSLESPLSQRRRCFGAPGALQSFPFEQCAEFAEALITKVATHHSAESITPRFTNWIPSSTTEATVSFCFLWALRSCETRSRFVFRCWTTALLRSGSVYYTLRHLRLPSALAKLQTALASDFILCNSPSSKILICRTSPEINLFYFSNLFFNVHVLYHIFPLIRQRGVK